MIRQWNDMLSLRVKATALVLGVVTLALVLVATTGMVQTGNQLATAQQRTVDATARGFARASELALAVHDKNELKRLVNGFLRDQQILFIAVYDAKGRLVTSGAHDVQTWEAYARNPKSSADFLVGQEMVTRSTADEDSTFNLSDGTEAATRPTAMESSGEAGAVLGRVVVAISTQPMQWALRRLANFTIVGTIAAAVFSAILVLYAIGTWSRRLDRLVGASQRISSGDLNYAIDDVHNDEIGRVSQAYEKMRQAVCKRDMELRKFNETLQEQVRERTHSLEQAVAAAEAADEAKSRFLATMSHEIRTPLNGVVGMIDLLRQTILDEHQQRYADVARSSADALLGVINDILDFSKIEAGRMELESVAFDLPNVVESLTEGASVLASKKGIELNCLIDPHVPDRVIGDPTRIRQVLTNLTNNAVKFTAKGHVTVRVTPEENKAGEVLLKFSVTDTGIGIPAERINRLFQSFSQVDASTTRQFGGTGLGLAISKRLVEMMAGNIGVESRPGKGSTFWFTVRLQKAPTQDDAKSGQALARIQNLRVLVVDDNSVNRDIIQQQLAAWKLAIQTAPDALEALSTLRQAAANGTPFDLAILDRNMPDMDGIDLAKMIHGAADLRSTALVMLTSVEDRMKADELKALGFAGYLVKPVRQSRLLDVIAEAVGQGIAVSANRAQEQQAEAGQAFKISRPAHILLAEDNEINQMVAREILTNAGCTCEIVVDGRKAVDAVFARMFDLVLMDCQMPELDGFEATRLIRQREAEESGKTGVKRHIRIVALTANAIKGDREHCLAAGMDDYLSKPIDPQQLIAAIEVAVAHKPAGAPVKVSPAAPAPPPALAAAPTIITDNADTAPPLDIAEFIHRCMNNATLAQKILDEYRARLGESVEQLAGAIHGGKLDEAARMAHSIKGAAANMSAGRMAQLAKEIELLSKSHEMQQATDMLEQLRTEVDACLKFIPQAIKNMKTPQRTP